MPSQNESTNYLIFNVMEFFALETAFTSGKYQGKTLEEVFNTDPKFIEQSLITNETFNISDETMLQLRELNPGFEFSERALDKREEKFDDWEDENDDTDDDEFYDEDLEEFDNFEVEEEDIKGKGSGKKDYDDFDDDFDSDFDDDFSSGFDDDDDDDDF